MRVTPVLNMGDEPRTLVAQGALPLNHTGALEFIAIKTRYNVFMFICY